MACTGGVTGVVIHVRNRTDMSGVHAPVAYAKPRPRGLLRIVLRIPQALYRFGLARWLGRRLLLLTTTGRRTGRPRTVGLNYATDEGTVYVVSGFGQADWYRNLLAQPQVTVQIGRSTWTAMARPVTAADEARRARALIRSTGARQGPPHVVRGLIARLGMDYDRELAVLDRDDLVLPIVALERASRPLASPA